MKDKNSVKYRGRVISKLPNLEFMVELRLVETTREARCILSGKMKLHKISVSIGDDVEIEPAGHLFRIIKRL